MDCSLPDSCIHEIFQAWILEWVVISFSRKSSQPRDWTQVSCNAGRFFTIWERTTLKISEFVKNSKWTFVEEDALCTRCNFSCFTIRYYLTLVTILWDRVKHLAQSHKACEEWILDVNPGSVPWDQQSPAGTGFMQDNFFRRQQGDGFGGNSSILHSLCALFLLLLHQFHPRSSGIRY